MTKKIVVLLLSLSIVFTFVSCSKRESAYIEYDGDRYGLYGENSIDFIFNSWELVYYIPEPFEKTLEYWEKSGNTFAVLKLKCTGDMTKAVYTSEEHFNFSGWGTDYENQFERIYVNFKAEVLEILEGDNIASVGDEITIDLTGFKIGTETFKKNNDQNEDTIGDEAEEEQTLLIMGAPGGINCTFPRMGYEYVVLVGYDPDLKVYEADMLRNACELSTPKDYVAFKKKLPMQAGKKNPYLQDKKTNEEKMPDVYWEILERYNIKVK